MTLLQASAFTDILKKVSDKISQFWWIILIAVIALIIILFLVIGAKNKRIRKLKHELKKTRTELETERSRAKNEQTFAPVTGGKKIFGEEAATEEETESVEFDAEEEVVPAKRDKKKEPSIRFTKNIKAEEPAPEKLSYYDKTTEVKQKGGSAKFIVKYDRVKDNWVIQKEGVDRAVRRVDTKEEALVIARSLCRKHDARLVVHKKDGKFQKQ